MLQLADPPPPPLLYPTKICICNLVLQKIYPPSLVQSFKKVLYIHSFGLMILEFSSEVLFNFKEGLKKGIIKKKCLLRAKFNWNKIKYGVAQAIILNKIIIKIW